MQVELVIIITSYNYYFHKEVLCWGGFDVNHILDTCFVHSQALLVFLPHSP